MRILYVFVPVSNKHCIKFAILMLLFQNIEVKTGKPISLKDKCSQTVPKKKTRKFLDTNLHNELYILGLLQ